MALTEAAAQELVAGWAAGIPVTWTPAQRVVLAQRVVSLSEALVPLVVEDVALSADQVSRYLSVKVGSFLDDLLVRAAATTAEALTPGDVHLTPAGRPSVGLVSADVEELAELPGVGAATATGIARYVTQVGLREIDDLDAVPGVGPARLEMLRRETYLDRPAATFLSPRLIDLLRTPTMTTFVAALQREGLQFFFGDATSLARHPLEDADSYTRLRSFLDVALTQARRAGSLAGGITNTKIVATLARRDLVAAYDAAAVSAGVESLVDGDYVTGVTALLDTAATSISVMLFLGTSAVGDPLHPGPALLVEALERAAGRQVEVRVILDRDDGTYRSSIVNAPLVARLTTAGITVKRDDENVLLHSKVVVVDDRAVVVGSHNWTRNAFTSTGELSLLITAPEVAKEFVDRFEALWARF